MGCIGDIVRLTRIGNIGNRVVTCVIPGRGGPWFDFDASIENTIQHTFKNFSVLKLVVPVISMPLLSPRKVDCFPRFNSNRLVSPIWLLVLGRTYGKYLHYERFYSKNDFFIRRSASTQRFTVFFPRDFSRNIQLDDTSEKCKMCSPFLGSGADADGAHSYSGPPRGSDDVLDSLLLPASCRIEGSFLDAVQCGRMCKVTWLSNG